MWYSQSMRIVLPLHVRSDHLSKVIGVLMRRLGALLEIDGALPVAAFSGSQILDAEDIAALEAALAQAEAEPEGQA